MKGHHAVGKFSAYSCFHKAPHNHCTSVARTARVWITLEGSRHWKKGFCYLPAVGYWDPPAQPWVMLENQVVEYGLKYGPW